MRGIYSMCRVRVLIDTYMTHEQLEIFFYDCRHIYDVLTSHNIVNE